ncbi:MAG: TRAP transporter small permease subunit [Gammaproteobacteria bacterium]
MSIVAIVFLQLPSTLRHGRMARADIFIDGFVERRPRAGHGLQALFHGLGAILCGVIIHATWPVFAKAWGNEEFIGVEGVFTAPTWPLRLIVLIGAAFTALQYLALAAQHLGEAHAA